MKNQTLKILLVDNYDSFTFNLYQYIGEILQERGENFHIDVFRNDEVTINQVKKSNYDRIFLSPGPGDPKNRAYFGVCADILQQISNIPIFGVCLGMQGIAYYFGGRVIKAKTPMHGKTSTITHTEKGIFAGLPQNVEVMRYHSLVADLKTLPDCLEVTAFVTVHPGEVGSFDKISDAIQESTLGVFQSGKIEIMGLQHKTLPIMGVQFHPESFATEGGKKILTNFLFKSL